MEATNSDSLKSMFSKLTVKDPEQAYRTAMNRSFGREIDTSKRVSHKVTSKHIDPPRPPITTSNQTDKKPDDPC